MNNRIPKSRFAFRTEKLAVIVIYWAFALGVLGLATAKSTPVSDLILAVFVLQMISLSIPLFFRETASPTWATPPVLASAFGFVALVRESPALVFGIPYHVALSDSASRLELIKSFELLLSAVGFAVYVIAYRFAPIAAVPLRFPGRLSGKLPVAEVNIARRAALIVCVAAGAAFIYALVQEGSLASRLLSLSGVRREILSGRHYMLTGLTAGVAACWVWLAIRGDALRNPAYWVILSIALATMYLLTGGRAASIAALAVVVLIWIIRNRTFPIARLALLGVVSIFIVGVLGGDASRVDGDGLLGELRSASPADVVVETAKNEFARRATVAGGALPILARVPDDVPFRYGATYVAAATAPVPRALWPSKPGLVDGQTGRRFFGTTAGIPPGPVGEAYWNFGVPGVLLVFFVFGVFHKWVARRLLHDASQPLHVAFYAVILVYFPRPVSSSLVIALQYAALTLVIYALATITLRSNSGTIHERVFDERTN